MLTTLFTSISKQNMAAANLLWASAVKIAKMKLLLLCLFVVIVYSQEIPINQVPDAFNQAVGQVTIDQNPSPIELSEDEATTLRNLVSNLISIGMHVEPEEIASGLVEVTDETELAKITSQADFKLRIKPKLAPNGGYAKPTRSITPSEGKKLESALLEVREWGFEVKAEII